MGLQNTLFNTDGQISFKVQQGESYTVGDTIQDASPSGAYLNPTTVFDAKRQSVGGMLYACFSDIAGPTAQTGAFQHKLVPGDVIAVSAVASGVVTVTITNNGVLSYSFTIAATAVAGVLGFWG